MSDDLQTTKGGAEVRPFRPLDDDEIRRLHPWEANKRDLVIQVPAGHTGVVVIDSEGRKRGRIDFAIVTDARDWERELGEARAAHSCAKFLREFLASWDRATEHPEGKGESPRARRVAFAEGLMEGVHGRGQPHTHDNPALGMIPPDWTRSGGRAFRDGWQLGMAICRAMTLAGDATAKFPCSDRA